MNTHSKGFTDANFQVLDLKRGFCGLFSASNNKLAEKEGTSVIYALYCLAEDQQEGARIDFGGKWALSGQRCGATRSDGAGLPPRVFGKPQAAPERKPALSPCACFSRGERAGGVGPSGFR